MPEFRKVVFEIFKLMDKYDLGEINLIRTARDANINVNFRTMQQVFDDISTLAIEMENAMEECPDAVRTADGKWKFIDPLEAGEIS